MRISLLALLLLGTAVAQPPSRPIPTLELHCRVAVCTVNGSMRAVALTTPSPNVTTVHVQPGAVLPAILDLTAAAVLPLTGTTLTFSGLTLLTGLAGQTSFLQPNLFVGKGLLLSYINSIVLLPSCLNLQAYIRFLCTSSPSPAVQIRPNRVVLENYTTAGVTAQNLTLLCADGTAPSYVPECTASTVASGTQLLALLLELAESKPSGTNTFLYVTQNISLQGLGLPRVSSPWLTINVTNKLTISGVASPGSPRPEVDWAGVQSLMACTRMGATVTLHGLTLANMPQGATLQSQVGFLTMLGYMVNFSRRGLGNSGYRLYFSSCTALLPADEYFFWAYWLNSTQPASLDEAGGWMRIVLADFRRVEVPANTSQLDLAGLAGQWGQWAGANLRMVSAEVLPPAAPLLVSESGVLRLRGPAYPALFPLVQFYSTTELAAFALTTPPVTPPSPVVNLFMRSFGYLSEKLINATAVCNRSVVITGDVINPTSLLLDLRALPPVVTLSPGTNLTVTSLLLYNAAPLPSAAVCGPAARQAGLPCPPMLMPSNASSGSSSSSSSDGGSSSSGGGGSGAWQDTTSPSGVSSGPAAWAALGGAALGSAPLLPPASGQEVEESLGGLTSVLWAFRFPRSLTPGPPAANDSLSVLIWLYNVTIMVPDLEMQAIRELLQTGSTLVNLQPATLTLMQRGLAGQQALPSQSWPPGGLTFPVWSWFGSAGLNVTLAPYTRLGPTGRPLIPPGPPDTTRLPLTQSIPNALTTLVPPEGPLLIPLPPPPSPLLPAAAPHPAPPAPGMPGFSPTYTSWPPSPPDPAPAPAPPRLTQPPAAAAEGTSRHWMGRDGLLAAVVLGCVVAVVGMGGLMVWRGRWWLLLGRRRDANLPNVGVELSKGEGHPHARDSAGVRSSRSQRSTSRQASGICATADESEEQLNGEDGGGDWPSSSSRTPASALLSGKALSSDPPVSDPDIDPAAAQRRPPTGFWSCLPLLGPTDTDSPPSSWVAPPRQQLPSSLPRLPSTALRAALLPPDAMRSTSRQREPGAVHGETGMEPVAWAGSRPLVPRGMASLAGVGGGGGSEEGRGGRGAEGAEGDLTAALKRRGGEGEECDAATHTTPAGLITQQQPHTPPPPPQQQQQRPALRVPCQDAVGAKQGVQQQRQALATALLQLQLELGGGVQVEEIQLVRRLGAGSFGTVYQGLWRNLEVAVKRVLFSHLASASAHHSRRQALHEVALNASLAHPNVVATYSYDMRPLGLSAQGLLTWELYIIQELCDAGSLLDALQAGGMWSHELQRADMCLVINAAQDIAAGMAYLHRKNILHGDLKPDNVLLRNTTQGTMAKVGDFGLSIKMAGNKTHVSGVRHGTPLYMAPEILRSERAAKAADVYAFGVMVWELLHGRTAWQQLMLMTDPHAPLPELQSLPHMHLLHWCDTPGVARPITPRCTPPLPSLSPPTLLPQPSPHSPPSFSAVQPPAALPSPSPASGPPGTASVPSAAAIQPGHSQSCPPPAASQAIDCGSSAALGAPPAAPPSCVPGSQPYGPPGQPTPEFCPHSASTSPAVLHTAQPGPAGARAVPPGPSLALTELACLAAACLEEEPGRRPQFESIQQQLARIVALAFQELASS